MPDGFVPLTAANIQDALGNKLASGWLEVLPTDADDRPIAATCNGPLTSPFNGPSARVAITGGALPNGTVIPQTDGAATKPQFLCFRLTIKDAQGFTLQKYSRVQPPAGGINLDTYLPNVAPQAIVQYGPPGPRGYDGAGSAAQLANLFAQVPASPNIWDPATQTIKGGGIVAPDGSIDANSNFDCTIQLPANAGGQMICTHNIGVDSDYLAFYDVHGVFVSSLQPRAGVAFNVPANALTFAFSPRFPVGAKVMICYGNTLPTTYKDPVAATPTDLATQDASVRADTAANLSAVALVTSEYATARNALVQQKVLSATTSPAQGGSALTLPATDNLGAPVAVYAYTQPFPVASTLTTIKMWIGSANAGDNIDVLIGTPGALSNGSLPITTKSRITLTLPGAISSPTLVTFTAGVSTGFASGIRVAAGDLIGWDGVLASGRAIPSYSTNGGGAGFAHGTAAAVGQSSSFGTSGGDVLVQGTTAATVTTIGQGAAALVPSQVQSVNPQALADALVAQQVLSVSSNAAVAGSPLSVNADSNLGNNGGFYVHSRPFTAAGLVNTVQLWIGSANAGDSIDVLFGSLLSSGSGSVSIRTNKRLRLTLTQAVTQRTLMTFRQGYDFTDVVQVAVNDVVGWAGDISSGHAVPAYSSINGIGFVYGASPSAGSTDSYSTAPADILVRATCLATSTSYSAGSLLASLSSVTALTAHFAPLRNLKWVNFGDSYSASYNNIWQLAVASRLGLNFAAQYAAGGRNMSTKGSPTNCVFTEFMQNGVVNTSQLATAIGDAQVITLYLGTNDAYSVYTYNYPIGQMGDTNTTGSVYGDYTYGIKTIRAAARYAKIYVIGPIHLEPVPGRPYDSTGYPNRYTDAVCDSVIAAVSTVCKAFGASFIDMRGCGIDAINQSHDDGSPDRLRDKLHPSDEAFLSCIAPTITGGIVAAPPR